MTSACDTCWVPGRCCSGFHLGGGNFPPTYVQHPLEALTYVARYMVWLPDGGVDTLPFMPLMKDSMGSWKFWCPNLTLAGRCGDYENRPFACSHYQPGTDELCVMHNIIAKPLMEEPRPVPQPGPSTTTLPASSPAASAGLRSS